MNHTAASAPLAETFEPRSETETRLHGYWLVLVRLVCLTLCLLSVGFYVAGILSYIANHYMFCTSAAAACHTYGTVVVPPNQGPGLSRDFVGIYIVVRDSLFSLGYWLVAAFLFWRKSNDRVALLAAVSLGTFPIVFNIGFISTLSSPWWFPASVVSVLGSLCFILFFYVFPSGHFVPRWMRWVFVVFLLYEVLNTFFPFAAFNPFSRSPVLGDLIFFGQIGSFVVVQLYRYRRVSSPAQRQQTKWVVYGISMGWGGYLVNLTLSLFFPVLTQTGPLVAVIASAAVYSLLLLIPLSLGFAIVRARLWDIDLIINRTLVYSILSACVVVVYVLVVGGLSTLLQARGNFLISLLATGLIAILFQPLRQRLQRIVNRLMYGDRDDPYRIISRLGTQLEATLTPDALLPAVAETVAKTLKLPYVAIELKEEEEFRQVAAYGAPIEPSLRLPLRYQQERIGQLLLASRGPGESFSAADRHLLDDLARQAGIAANAVRLSADLQRSRERLLLAREEERHRLARELHDSVSQALYGISLGAHAARAALSRDPDHVAEPLDYVLTLAEAALVEMRALIFELRPESLEREGLVAALARQGAALQARHDMLVQTDLCEEPRLSLTVKQELYRIAQEAMHNTVKHAHARQVVLHLEQAADGVILEVRDDGAGFDTTASFPGHLGLQSMRERITNLGGTLQIESMPGAGTRICVCIRDTQVSM